jgi:hypothetical protein
MFITNDFLQAFKKEPLLWPDPRTTNGNGNERGKQKRQRLLAYLRERAEELRPFAGKLIAEHRRVAASRRRQASGERAWLNPGGEGG